MVDSALSDLILNQGPEVTNELDITDAVGQGITNDNEVTNDPEITYEEGKSSNKRT